MVYVLAQKNVASNVFCYDFTIPQYELTKLDLDHAGCDLNKRSRETVLLAVAIAGYYAREVKADLS